MRKRTEKAEWKTTDAFYVAALVTALQFFVIFNVKRHSRCFCVKLAKDVWVKAVWLCFGI